MLYLRRTMELSFGHRVALLCPILWFKKIFNFLSQVRVLSDRVFLKEKINAQKSCFLASRSQREAADAFSKLSLLYVFWCFNWWIYFCLWEGLRIVCVFFMYECFLFAEGHGENQVREPVMRSVFKTLPKTKIDSAIETPKTQSKLNLERRPLRVATNLLKSIICVHIFFF